MGNIATLQLPIAIGTNKQSVLRQDDLRKYSVPERGSVTHRGEAQGKQKMALYA